MKTGTLSLGLTLAATLAAQAGAADLADSSVLGSAQRAASLDSTTRRSVIEFVDAYANLNPSGLAHATTGDFEVQYGLAQTGTYVTVDEDTLVASWRDSASSSASQGQHTTVALFPTADAHAVFVTYRIPGNAGGERIALLELRGGRVARAHDLIAPAPQFLEFPGWTKNARTIAADHDAALGQ